MAIPPTKIKNKENELDNMKIKNKINKGDIDGRKYWIHPIHLTYSFEHLQV